MDGLEDFLGERPIKVTYGRFMVLDHGTYLWRYMSDDEESMMQHYLCDLVVGRGLIDFE